MERKVPTFRVRPMTTYQQLERWLGSGPAYRAVKMFVDHDSLVVHLRGRAPQCDLKKKVVLPLRQATAISIEGVARSVARFLRAA